MWRSGILAFWRLGVVELHVLLCYFVVAFGEEDLDVKGSGGCLKVLVEGSAVLIEGGDGFKVGWWKNGLHLKSSTAVHVEFICPWPSNH